ncbi:hypothetical protein I3271_00890 [Photobacterium leiognathi]|uniref:hypothetical protein n=1 Tax=Photobacterium leiognathi TaxID=553611 RepID=UPI001EDDD78C|nr:hypothetical protein [Photobacterium leiognathi]MCG3883238.1 hypothetical protein [Photobacterium leiognathi]
MNVVVPFLYEAVIVKPRCRKKTAVAIVDTIEVEIKEVSSNEVPVALAVGEVKYFFDGENLYKPSITVHDDSKSTVSAQDIEDSLNKGYINRFESAAAPFNGVKPNYIDSMSTVYGLASDIEYLNFLGLENILKMSKGDYSCTKSNVIPTKNNIAYREWFDDNRKFAVEKVEAIASALLIIDGIVCKKALKPMYYALTFGLGGNHGGTALFIGNYTGDPENATDCQFNALQFEDAKKTAAKIAEDRGDTMSISKVLSGTNSNEVIEVLIPEAVKMPHNDYLNNLDKQ